MYADAVIPMKGSARSSLTDRFSEVQRQREQKFSQQNNAPRLYVNNNNNQTKLNNNGNNTKKQAPKQVHPAINAQARALLQAARQAARTTQVAARRNIDMPKTANGGTQTGGAKRKMPPKQRQANGNGKQRNGAVPAVGNQQKRQQLAGKLGKRMGAMAKKTQPENRPLIQRLGPKKGEKQLPPSVKNMKTPLSQNLLKRIRLAQLSTALGGKKVVRPVATPGNKQLVRKPNAPGKQGTVKIQTKGVKSNNAAGQKQGSPAAQNGKKRRNKIRTAGTQAGTQKPTPPKQKAPKTPKKETDPEKLRAQLDLDMDTYMAPVCEV